jgi:transcription elongation factor Elf1
MDFLFRCPKCNSSSVSRSDPTFTTTPGHFSIGCSMCGWALYGTAKISAEVDAQHTQWRKSEREAKKRREALRVAQEAYTWKRWEKRHESAQAIRTGRGLCANLKCDKGPEGKRPADKRESSTYCSRECCVMNARLRDRVRKKFKSESNERQVRVA